MIRKIFLFLVLLSGFIYPQSITFEEFLSHSKSILNVKALPEIKKYFPDNFIITSLDYGDFSGDTRTDFAIAVKPLKTRGKDIYVFMFCDSSNQYIPVFSDTLAYYELPIEIGFNIADGVCFVTHKTKENSWTITGYSFQKNEFSIVDYYTTDVNPLNKKSSIGIEKYESYRDLNAFLSFYSPITLKELKKNKFFIHPVYDLKRNIYKGYKEKHIIDKSWVSDDPSSIVTDSSGNIYFAKNNGHLILNLDLKLSLFAGQDSSLLNKLKLYFDRSGDKFIENKTSKEPIFREGFDNDMGWIEVNYALNNLNNPDIQKKFGDNFQDYPVDSIRVKLSKDEALHLKLEIPISLLNILPERNEIGMLLSIIVKLNNGNVLVLSNSNGTPEDPLAYGRLLFINNGNYFGLVKNYRFKDIIEKLYLNGIIKGKFNN